MPAIKGTLAYINVLRGRVPAIAVVVGDLHSRAGVERGQVADEVQEGTAGGISVVALVALVDVGLVGAVRVESVGSQVQANPEVGDLVSHGVPRRVAPRYGAPRVGISRGRVVWEVKFRGVRSWRHCQVTRQEE
jgi:hypothetical protein